MKVKKFVEEIKVTTSIEELLNCKWMKEGDFSKSNFQLLNQEFESRKSIVSSKKSSS